MKCEDVRDRLVEYLLGELSEADRMAVEGHLLRCKGCSIELDGARQVMKVTQMADDQSITNMANQMIQLAFKRRASDIHLELDHNGPRVRIRVDGVLVDIGEDLNIAAEQFEPLITRLKVMSNCKLSERQMPQDGRMIIQLAEDARMLDIRVSFIPTIHGERATMRILDQNSVSLNLDRVGLSGPSLKTVQELCRLPHGIVLVTGPVGSGKTTTIYSMLRDVASPELSILTIEDPVEYDLEGISQCQVNVAAGLRFATALRSFLRQDPDIIMVGEIRDLETAELIAQASITGHLVMTTLHTEDSFTALIRMIEIGLPPFMVAASVVGVISQRLVRMICSECRTAFRPPDRALIEAGLQDSDGSLPEAIYRGTGCHFCQNRGYRGRIGVQEVLVMTPTLHDRVASGASVEELRQAAIAGGMKTLREDAMAKVRMGVTTLEEAQRVLG